MLYSTKFALSPLIAACLIISACSDSDSDDTADVPASNTPVAADQDSGANADPLVPVAPAPVEPVTGGEEPGEPITSQPGSGEPIMIQPGAGEPSESNPPPSDGNSGAVPLLEDGSPVVNTASATGADTIDGPQDDSPTQTESLSLAGPFIKDVSRGAGPPSAPTGLTQLMAAENWVEFTWAPSSDDQSVEAYEVYRDGVLIGTVRYDSSYEHDIRSWISTSFIDCNYTRYANCVDDSLQPQDGASYSYTVVAVDNEGMRSEPSEPAVFSMVTPGQSTVDLTGYQAVFSEEFNDTKLDISRWKTSLPWGPDEVINRELQYFVNIFGSSNPVDYNPFVFTGETLQITGIRTPADQLAAANGQPYLSGVLTTADYFEMTYGYVEMSAKLAAGEGLLSTFYLFNQGFYKNKPEIDIVEYLGARPDKAYQTYHYYDSNRARATKGEKHSSPTMETLTNQNLSSGFHTYGVLWEPGLVIWYIDGQEVRRLEGVRVSDEPMNIVAQLVMGSEWIGEPDPNAVPAVVEIDYIRAYQKQ